MSTPSVSRPAERHTPEESRQAFVEDTKDLVAELRALLELPQLTDEQRRQAQDLTDSLIARCRQGRAGETDDGSPG